MARCFLARLSAFSPTCLEGPPHAPWLQTALCQHFGVDRYPTLLWGDPRQFAANLRPGADARSGLHVAETARTGEAVVAWINEKTHQ